MTKAQKVIRSESIADLRKLLKVGDTVTTATVHVSASGMMRHLRLFVKDEQDGLRDITYLATLALGDKPTIRKGFGYYVLKASGCGMDMGFDAVYTLASVLFPKGRTDGGYALQQRWL